MEVDGSARTAAIENVALMPKIELDWSGYGGLARQLCRVGVTALI